MLATAMAAVRPTYSDGRTPMTSCEKMSRPMLVVPSQCAALGGNPAASWPSSVIRISVGSYCASQPAQRPATMKKA